MQNHPFTAIWGFQYRDTIHKASGERNHSMVEALSTPQRCWRNSSASPKFIPFSENTQHGQTFRPKQKITHNGDDVVEQDVARLFSIAEENIFGEKEHGTFAYGWHISDPV